MIPVRMMCIPRVVAEALHAVPTPLGIQNAPHRVPLPTSNGTSCVVFLGVESSEIAIFVAILRPFCPQMVLVCMIYKLRAIGEAWYVVFIPLSGEKAP